MLPRTPHLRPLPGASVCLRNSLHWGRGCNYDPELFLHSLDLWFPKKGDPDVRAPHRPGSRKPLTGLPYTLRIHGGLVLSTLKLCPGAVSPHPQIPTWPQTARLWEKSGPQNFRLLPPQLSWVGSSGRGLEAALGLRGQPSARLQNSSCVHIKPNERKMPFLAPRARSADIRSSGRPSGPLPFGGRREEGEV